MEKAKRRCLYIIFLERLRGDRRRNCMNASELQFLGWGSEKNIIYKHRRDLAEGERY